MNPGAWQSPDALRRRVLRLLGDPAYIPGNAPSISSQLGLSAEEDALLPGVLAELESRGDVVRLRPDRYLLRESLVLPGAPSPEAKPAPARRRRRRPQIDSDSEIAKRYNLRTDFSEAVLAEASKCAAPGESDFEGREDCREDFVFTIDPDDARDFDDAICIKQMGAGWELTVHIADVSHYVKPGSALSRESRLRGNSVYLVTRVLPMLPERLSNDLCSLRPQEDRLTMFVRLRFDRNGKPASASFGRGVIRSRHRLTYTQAFTILNDAPSSEELAVNLHRAGQLAAKLRRNRFASGALDLDFPDVKVRVDEHGTPYRLELVENDAAHQLIEEFMLAANEAVATELREKLIPAVYRVHESPDPEKLAEFRETAALHGLRPGDLAQRKELTKLISAIGRHPSERILKYALLRSLKRAAYDTKPLGHFGLAKANYTHFTSPIRRYADLLVHRALEQAAGLELRGNQKRSRRKPLLPADLQAAADHISGTERIATEAERESVLVKKLEYLEGQIVAQVPDVFEGIIVEILRIGCLVELPRFLLTGLVPIGSLPGEFRYDTVRRQLTGMRTRQTFRIGDKLQVIVARIDFARQQVDFQLAG